MYSNVEEIIKQKGLKASDISKGTGIATSTLSEWKSGKHVPSTKTIRLLADYLEVPIEVILHGQKFVSNEGTEVKVAPEIVFLSEKISKRQELQRLLAYAEKLAPDAVDSITDMIEKLNG